MTTIAMRIPSLSSHWGWKKTVPRSPAGELVVALLKCDGPGKCTGVGRVLHLSSHGAEVPEVDGEGRATQQDG